MLREICWQRAEKVAGLVPGPHIAYLRDLRTLFPHPNLKNEAPFTWPSHPPST